MPGYTEQRSVESLVVGTRVEARNRFTGTWSAGFEVDGTSGGGYWLRHLSDGTVMPMILLADDVRPEGRSSVEIDLTRDAPGS